MSLATLFLPLKLDRHGRAQQPNLTHFCTSDMADRLQSLSSDANASLRLARRTREAWRTTGSAASLRTSRASSIVVHRSPSRESRDGRWMDHQPWITHALSQSFIRLVVPPEVVSSFFPGLQLQSLPQGLLSSSLLTSLLLGGRCECAGSEKSFQLLNPSHVHWPIPQIALRQKLSDRPPPNGRPVSLSRTVTRSYTSSLSRRHCPTYRRYGSLAPRPQFLRPTSNPRSYAPRHSRPTG